MRVMGRVYSAIRWQAPFVAVGTAVHRFHLLLTFKFKRLSSANSERIVD